MSDRRPEPRVFVRPRRADAARQSYTAQERARIRGWAVNASMNPAPPHAFGAKCIDPRCPHRGRSVLHFKRGP